MKRPFRCLLVFSVVAVIAAYSWKVWESEAAYQWQEMPKGDAVRLQQVTYGRKHEFRSEKVWLERFSEAIHSRSLRPLSAGNRWSGYSPDTNVPSTVVLLRCRTANIPSIGDSTLSLPKGQTFWIGTHSASGNGQGVIIRFEFPFVPNHGEELRFTTTLNGQHYAFEFRHPIHPASPTTWKAAPLPQTQTNGAVSLTLNALTLEYVANAIRFFDWKAKPKWTITMEGRDAAGCFMLETEYEDEGGNKTWQTGLLSEPVWKIRALLSRTERFPFTDSEIRWIGTFDTQHAPAEQEYTLFPIDPALEPKGPKIAGLFGAGQYDIANGTTTPSGPPVPLNENYPVKADWDLRM